MSKENQRLVTFFKHFCVEVDSMASQVMTVNENGCFSYVDATIYGETNLITLMDFERNHIREFEQSDEEELVKEWALLLEELEFNAEAFVAKINEDRV